MMRGRERDCMIHSRYIWHYNCRSCGFIFQLTSLSLVTSFYCVYVASLSTSHDVSRWRNALSSCQPSIAFYEELPSRQYSNSISLHSRQLDNLCPTFFDYSVHPRNRNIRSLLLFGFSRTIRDEESRFTGRQVPSLMKFTFRLQIRVMWRRWYLSLFACFRNGLFIASRERLGLLDVSSTVLSLVSFRVSSRNVSHEGLAGERELMVFTYIRIRRVWDFALYTKRIHLPTRHTLPISFRPNEMFPTRFDAFSKGFFCHL